MGSDHCCFTSEQKDLGSRLFEDPDGVPGTENILPILFSGVARGALSLERLVEVCCTNPAKQYGLYPRKGTIQIGSDADITILDPRKKVRISKDNLHSRMDNTIYEGISVTGYPVMTFSRGSIVHEEGQFTGRSRGEAGFVPGVPETVWILADRKVYGDTRSRTNRPLTGTSPTSR